MSEVAVGGAAGRLATAVDGWYRRNVPAPRIALVCPVAIDAISADFELRRAPNCGGLRVLGVEVVPDRRVDPGIVVFVDADFNFIGATRLSEVQP